MIEEDREAMTKYYYKDGTTSSEHSTSKQFHRIREIINAFINPSLGLTSSNPKVRTLAEEIHSSGLTQNSK